MGIPAYEADPDAAGTASRMDAIRLKQILGGALTDQELMCLQIEANGFGCKSCPPPAPSRDLPSEG